MATIEQAPPGHDISSVEVTSPLQNLLARAYAVDWATIFYVTIFIIAVLSRLINLGDRVMSHDESLHVKFSWDLWKNGIFQHTPLMHGPVLFHMTALMYALFGDNDFSGRLYPAILGIIMVMMPKLLFERWLGKRGAMVTSILLLISPMVLYHNRYIREDTPALFFTLLMVYAIFAYLDGVRPRQVRWLALLAASTLLSLASKESGFMYIAAFGLVLTIYWLLQVTQGIRSGKTDPIVGWVIGLAIAVLAVGGLSYGVGSKLSDVFAAGGTQISGGMLAVPIFLIVAVVFAVLIKPIRFVLEEVADRANSMFKLVLAGLIVGTIAALAVTCVTHIITDQQIERSRVAWTNYDQQIAQMQAAPPVQLDQAGQPAQPINSAPIEPTEPRPEALVNRSIIWIVLAASVLALAVVGTALLRFSRSPRLPWMDMAMIVLFAIAFCVALIIFEERSNIPKPGGGEETSATQLVNDIYLLPVWLGGIVLTAGILYLRFATRFWEALKAYPVFDVLITLGSLTLPWLSAVPMWLAGYALDANSFAADVVLKGILYTLPFVAVATAAGLSWNPTAWLLSAATFYSIFVFFYTTIFTNINGIATGLVGSLGYWLVQQGVRRGSQPQYYYLLLELPVYEYLPVIGSILAGIAGLFSLWRFRASRFEATDQAQEAYQANLLMQTMDTGIETGVDIGQTVEQAAMPTDPADPGDPAVTQISATNETIAQMETSEFVDPTVDPTAETPGAEPIVLESPQIDEPEWLERVPFMGFVGVWAVLIITFFTVAGEKMPWLTTQLTVPLIIATGWYIGSLMDKVDWEAFWQRTWGVILLSPILIIALFNVISPFFFGTRPFAGLERDDLLRTFTWMGALLVVGLICYGIYRIWRQVGTSQVIRVAALGFFALLALMTARTAWMAAYINYDYATEFMVYAHGAPAAKQIMTTIEDISKRTTDGLNAKVAYDDKVSWPGSWYFRNYTSGSFKGDMSGVSDLDQYVAIVVGDEHAAKVDTQVGDLFYKFNYIRLWWPMQDYFDLNMGRVDNIFDISGNATLPAGWVNPAMLRQGLWDIWWNRDYSAYAKATNKTMDVSQWPVADRMSVYIRKDVAAQIWDYGTGSTRVNTLPSDPFKALHCEGCAANAVFGGQGNQPGLLDHPRDISAGPDGNLYVADALNSRIVVFSPDGAYLNQLGTPGSVEQNAPGGTFHEPWGIAVGNDGKIYIADTWNHRVQVLDQNGTFLQTWGAFEQVPPGTVGRPDGFWGPRDIAVDAQNRVYVADTGNKRVRVYDGQGTWLYDIGQGGSDQGQLDEPVGLAINSETNEIYVADTWNRRIQVFDLSGGFLRSWAVQAWSATRDTGSRPYLTLDKNGTHLFVADPDAARILVYDTNGNPTVSFGNQNSAPTSSNEFAALGGITAASDGNIFVVDSGSGRILRFPAETLPNLVPPQPVLPQNNSGGEQQPAPTNDVF
jgi:predicted membrane-bound mannosyltransferase/DNA-binding beta-propeller fold protein YncE